MLASRRAPVEALNRLARTRLCDEGSLGEEEVAGGRAFAVGDAVIAGKNDYPIGLLNGSRGIVTAVDTRRSRITVETSEDRSVDVPTRYLAAGHLAHGYATTVHQGAVPSSGLVFGGVLRDDPRADQERHPHTHVEPLPRHGRDVPEQRSGDQAMERRSAVAPAASTSSPSSLTSIVRSSRLPWSLSMPVVTRCM